MTKQNHNDRVEEWELVLGKVEKGIKTVPLTKDDWRKMRDNDYGRM